MAQNFRANRIRLGATIRRLRMSRGWSLEEFASRVGRSPNYMGLVERGQANVSLDTLTAMSTQFSISIAELFGGSHVGADAITQADFEAFDHVAHVIKRLKSARLTRGESR
jgi:transcriptional regulator with XRE-family HTH domain